MTNLVQITSEHIVNKEDILYIVMQPYMSSSEPEEIRKMTIEERKQDYIKSKDKWGIVAKLKSVTASPVYNDRGDMHTEYIPKSLVLYKGLSKEIAKYKLQYINELLTK